MSKHYSVGMTLRDSEKEIIIDCLRFFHGNKSMTARSLGISKRGLDGKIKDMEIEIERSGFEAVGDESENSGDDRKEDKKNSKR